MVVIQGSGAIGLFTLVAALESGAAKTVVVGAPESRLELARKFGADVTINIEEITEPQESTESYLKEILTDEQMKKYKEIESSKKTDYES